MKTCYNCFHMSDENTRFCGNCGFPLDHQNENTCADALPCGTTLYGRYLIGRVLQQDDAFITYIAQDSRSKGTVAVREYFPRQYSKRNSLRNVSIPEEDRDKYRDEFLEGKELFLKDAENLSEELDFDPDSDQPPFVQAYFSQNDTAYLAFDYGTPENLKAFLSGVDLVRAILGQKNPAAVNSGAKDLVKKTHSQGSLAEDGSMGTAPEQSIPAENGSAETDPGKSLSKEGGRKVSLLPVAIIFGIFAALIICLILLLPHAFAGSDDISKSINLLYEQIRSKYQDIADWINDDSQERNDKKDIFRGDDYYDNVRGGLDAGNYLNKGFFTQYGDEYFFSNTMGFYRTSDETLTDYDLISNTYVGFLNQYEGYIYYPDEKEGTIVCYDPDDDSSYAVFDYKEHEDYIPETLYIYDGQCYFSNKNNLYCFDLEDYNGSSALRPRDVDLLLEDFNTPGHVFQSLCFTGRWLIYDGIDGATAVDLESYPEKKVLTDVDGYLISNGKDIFCLFGTNHIFKLNFDGAPVEVVHTDRTERITGINCNDERLYYSTKNEGDSKFWSVSLDGGEPEYLGIICSDDEEVTTDVYSFCLLPESDYAFFYLLSAEGEHYYSYDTAIPLEQ